MSVTREMEAFREERDKARSDADQAIDGAAKSVAERIAENKEQMLPAPIKRTARIRRGLERVHLIATEAADPDKPPGYTRMAGWKKEQRAEYEDALRWIAQQSH